MADAFPSSDVIDAHLHVWGEELLGAPWLNAAESRSLRRAFSLEDAARMHVAEGISSAVVVTADETYDGTALLLARCDGRPDVTAVVGSLDLRDPELAGAVDALRAGPGGHLLRGLRLVDLEEVREDPDALGPALEAMQDRGLVLEVLTSESGLDRVLRLCEIAPGMPVVVDHLGNPDRAGDRGGWRDAISRLATVRGAHLKVSGAVTQESDFGSILSHVLDAFGAARLMAGTDWPVSARTPGAVSSWRRIVDATTAWTAVDRESLFAATAERVYGRTST